MPQALLWWTSTVLLDRTPCLHFKSSSSSLFSPRPSGRARPLRFSTPTRRTLGRVPAQLGIVQVVPDTVPPAGHVLLLDRSRLRDLGLNGGRFFPSFLRGRGRLLVVSVGPFDTVSNATALFCCVPTLIELVSVCTRTCLILGGAGRGEGARSSVGARLETADANTMPGEKGLNTHLLSVPTFIACSETAITV